MWVLTVETLMKELAKLGSDFHEGLRERVEMAPLRTGTPIMTSVPPDLDAPHHPLVASAVRELLTNVAKHAPGAQASVVIEPAGELLLIEVSDDGPGFDPSIIETAVLDGHVGLASLHARIDAVGGRTEFMPTSDRGTRVRITLPAG